MNWSAPQVEHLLEQRLQQARLELMEDTRIQEALDRRGGETPAFLQDLIAGKLHAAARHGLEAVEASLRAGASDCLLAQGLSVDLVRAQLKREGDRLLALGEDHTPREGGALLTAPLAAGLLFAAWTAAALGAWRLLELHPLVCMALVGAGGVPAVGLHAYLKGNEAIGKKALVSELPARICRQYLRRLGGAVDAYAAAVNAVAQEHVESSADARRAGV